ncbi:alpha-protein kinase 1 [Impatiens glandulifera]|uniref:alpha-protein kinase 1 n=1 Tax=Impatiens glandulifera TaxID=253017 RepID=UPI001FB05839|nr:alpha-protein kinase 1 [Impatiens glandulifera]
MVSDQDIARGVEIVLRQSNPNSVTTLNGIVQQLEVKLGQDLSHKASFIKDQINLLLGSPPPPQTQPQTQTQQQQQQPLKDHFALQQQNVHYRPQGNPQFLSHFTLQQQQQQHHLQQQFHHHQQQQQQQQQQQIFRAEDLNFRHPFPSQQVEQQQQQQQPAATHLQTAPVGKAVIPNAAAKATKTPKSSAPAGTKRKGGAGGLNKVCGISPLLQVVVGQSALPRTEIVKQLWAYIRKHNLQDPSNKRKIICDEALEKVFETDCTDMFKMNKLLAKHILPLDPTTQEASQSKRMKTEDVDESSNSTNEIPKPSSPTLVVLSDALTKFLGVGERQMLHSEVHNRVWEYIKTNHLEDPLNSMSIICDEKLRELLGCESISALGVPEMLARHHLFKQ